MQSQYCSLQGVAAGIDVVFDPVGGFPFTEALKTLKWGGQIAIIGFASGTIPKVIGPFPDMTLLLHSPQIKRLVTTCRAGSCRFAVQLVCQTHQSSHQSCLQGVQLMLYSALQLISAITNKHQEDLCICTCISTSA